MSSATTLAPRGSAAGESVGAAPSSFDPGALMASVEEGASRLETAAGVLHDAVVRYERAEASYERGLQLQLIAIYHKSKETGERMPAEDVRRALAHDDLDNEVYGEFLEAKAQREALQVRYRALSASVSARQSLLKAISGAGG